MPTTALLVEIVIVGFTFFLSIIPLIDAIFGVRPQSVLTFYENVPIQFQLAAAYAAGIIWNRVCDQIFHRLDERIIRSKFTSRETYQAARIKVVLQGESIRDYIGNFRSLIRVSRACSVLFVIYGLALPFYIFNPMPLIAMNALSKILIILFEFVVLSVSIYAWLRLERGYVSAVCDAYTAIVSDNKQ